ncbi:MAG TPA: exodeoxyribonuclease VII large subunit, partial [Spirochaetia bacterium]|nr:exodeoxyribonuclease VII large subunit [Spirochaetia bacterium]
MLDKILEYLVKESRSREFRTADGKTIRGIIKDFYLTSRGVEVKFFSEKTQGLKEFNFEDVLTIDNMAPDVFLHNTAAETPAAGPLPERMVFSVSSITRLIKKKLTESFSGIWVSGEVSNFTLSAAGHMYFNLKDEQALLKVVFFSGRSRNLKFKIADGLKLEVYGALSVYEKSGAYQLLADRVIPEGKGAQQLAFEQLKEKLLKEGLFDKKHKKPLPLFPETIGIITSPTGAAFRDILRVSKEIFPRQHFILYPAAVQGSEAAPSMIRMIEIANRRAECDVLIVGRGGGSAEDLMSFNDEALARAIFRSGIPVISAVGHEIDYFICDFTADH